MFRKLAGRQIWLDTGILPQALLIGYIMQRCMPTIKVEYLLEGNQMLKEIKLLTAAVYFKPSDEKIRIIGIKTFSDAPFNISTARTYGQSGTVSVLSSLTDEGREVYHIID